MFSHVQKSSEVKRPLPKALAYLDGMLLILLLLGYVAIAVTFGYVFFTGKGIDSLPEWITTNLAGGVFLISIISSVVSAASNTWQYGHVKLGNTLALMLWMLLLGFFSGVKITDNYRLTDTDRILIVHGVNSMVEKYKDDPEKLEHWCQDRLRYEQEYKGYIIPSIPEICKK